MCVNEREKEKLLSAGEKTAEEATGEKIFLGAVVAFFREREEISFLSVNERVWHCLFSPNISKKQTVH